MVNKHSFSYRFWHDVPIRWEKSKKKISQELWYTWSDYVCINNWNRKLLCLQNELRSGSCHFDRASNDESIVEFRIIVIVMFFNSSQVLKFGSPLRYYKDALTQRSFLVNWTSFKFDFNVGWKTIKTNIQHLTLNSSFAALLKWYDPYIRGQKFGQIIELHWKCWRCLYNFGKFKMWCPSWRIAEGKNVIGSHQKINQNWRSKCHYWNSCFDNVRSFWNPFLFIFTQCSNFRKIWHFEYVTRYFIPNDCCNGKFIYNMCFVHPICRLFFGHFGCNVTKMQNFYVIFCLHFGRQDWQDGKNRKENHATKVTKIPKTKRQKYGMNETLLYSSK